MDQNSSSSNDNSFCRHLVVGSTGAGVVVPARPATPNVKVQRRNKQVLGQARLRPARSQVFQADRGPL